MAPSSPQLDLKHLLAEAAPLYSWRHKWRYSCKNLLAFLNPGFNILPSRCEHEISPCCNALEVPSLFKGGPLVRFVGNWLGFSHNAPPSPPCLWDLPTSPWRRCLQQPPPFHKMRSILQIQMLWGQQSCRDVALPPLKAMSYLLPNNSASELV